jgi:hypothetical protein
MSRKFMFCHGLTGGTTGSLDSIVSTDITENSVTFTEESGFLYAHYYDTTSALSESSPDVIKPDDLTVTDAGRWLILSVGLEPGALTEILVGSGGSVPTWTTATGTGAPVRATSPTIVTPVLTSPAMTTPVLGEPTSGDLSNCNLADALVTAGSGTGITVDLTGRLRSQIYKVTVDYTAFADTDTAKGVVIATLPAKMKIVGCYAGTTTKYIGGAVTAATLKVGKAAEAAVEILAAHDVFTAVTTKGLADADMGTGMTRAAQIQGGYMLSWTDAVAIYATITTTTANTNALTQGSTTYYIETIQY